MNFDEEQIFKEYLNRLNLFDKSFSLSFDGHVLAKAKMEGFTIEHFQAIYEIRLIDSAITQAVNKDVQKEQRLNFSRETALEYFDRNKEQFRFIKRKYLEDINFYKKVEEERKNNRIRTFYGELMVNVYRDTKLKQIGKQKLYDFLIEAGMSKPEKNTKNYE